MKQLLYQLTDAPSLRLEDGLPPPGVALDELQKLTGGMLLDDDTACADVKVLPPTAEGRRGMRFDTVHGCTFRVKPPATEAERTPVWRQMLLLAIANRVLKGDRIALLHGCLLKTRSGEGIILCGQSGMGKSTTGRRWKDAGGECPADDMMLLEYGGDTLRVHPLPTWSRCIVSLDGEFYPFDKALPVKSVIALNRGMDCEELKETTDSAYMMAIYGSCTLFNLNLASRMSAAHREQLMVAIKERALFLFERFPHRALFAHLQADLTKTLANAGLI